MNRTTLFSYFKTVSLTVLAAFLCVVLLTVYVQHQVYDEQRIQQKAEDDTVDYYLIDVMIGKNKYLEQQYPDDYKINLKLGTLYKIKKDFNNSEIQYKIAIEKAPYGQYKPEYQLALLYIATNDLDKSQTIMDDIEDKPDKKLIRYKADIYNKLGDIYYNQTDYENAVAKYQKSLLYYKIIKAKEVKLLKGNLASAYIYLAEDRLAHNRIDEAVNSLQLAEELVDAPIIKYKLALLSIPHSPNLAYKYFDEVFQVTPEIINYDTYYKFLNELARESDNRDDKPTGDLYRYKAKLLRDYFKTNIVSVDDVEILDLKGTITKRKFFKQYNIKVNFKLKNTSKNDIDSLWLQIIFKDGNQVIDSYSQQVANKDNILKKGDISPIINLTTLKKKLKDDDDYDSIKRINVEIYISRTEQTYKLLLKNFTIVEDTNAEESNNIIVEFFMDAFEKIASKLPASFF